MFSGNIADVVAVDLIVWQDENHVMIKSFTDPESVYTIALDDHSTMITCTCPDFVQRGAMCKHMYLLNRIENVNLPIVQYSSPLSLLAHREQTRPPLQVALFEESLPRFYQAMERLSEQAQRVNANNYSPASARYLNQVSQSLENAWSILKTCEQSRPGPERNHQNRF